MERVAPCNDQVHTTPHPVLNFLGIYMNPVQRYPSLFFGAQQLTAEVSVHIMVYTAKVCFFQELAMGMTLVMKMTFVLVKKSKCSYQ